MGDNTKILDRRPQRRAGMPTAPVKVMIVDDSLTVRSILSRMIDGEDDFEVVSKSSSAELALKELKHTPVDVILLDLEMPGMGGLAALPKILAAHDGIQALVVSSLTEDGAEHTLKALSMGAADTMPKPRAGQFDALYCNALFDKIRALGARSSDRTAPKPVIRVPTVSARLASNRSPKVIAIGGSTGGIHAMCQFLQNLDPHISLPILVTQHLPASFMSVFARQLEIASGRIAHVAENGMTLNKGELYIAPGTGHLSVEARGDDLAAKITHETATSGCTPSVDPMFRSLAKATDGRAIGVVFSGMGKDGSEGAVELCESGGTILVQDQETCAVWGMPGSIAKKGLASAILPPDELGKKLAALLGSAAWK